jgi:hypothetical protein
MTAATPRFRIAMWSCADQQALLFCLYGKHGSPFMVMNCCDSGSCITLIAMEMSDIPPEPYVCNADNPANTIFV